jgi:hypothetical protein
MRYHEKTKKLYYPTTIDSRIESWPTRYKGVSQKTVAKRMWAEQVKHYIFIHVAVKIAVIRIKEKFYLKLNLSSIITEDGRRVSIGMKKGSIITLIARISIRFFIQFITKMVGLELTVRSKIIRSIFIVCNSEFLEE